MPSKVENLLSKAPITHLSNVTSNGSAKALCAAATDTCEALEFETVVLTDHLCCQTKKQGISCIYFAITPEHQKPSHGYRRRGDHRSVNCPMFGRPQLGACPQCSRIDCWSRGCNGLAVFSIGSDGTDGPPDAADRHDDHQTIAVFKTQNIDDYLVLQNNFIPCTEKPECSLKPGQQEQMSLMSQ